ncbi:MAG: recombinase family protein, partial [Hyphomicrobiales bacterium]
VHYCAEQFENDGSIGSSIIKTVKRAMAGEYSRELSVKVRAGQANLIRLGYRQGGAPGYGLRRMLVDQTGTSKGELQRGEQKSIATDRVILIPGDPTQIATVQRIFRLAAKGESNAGIAEILNSEGLPSPKGGLWGSPTIRLILMSERYLGANIYNRASTKLGGRRVNNPRESWIVSQHPFEPIVPPKIYRTVQSLRRTPKNSYSDEELLGHLRTLIDEHGYVASSVIDAAAPPASKTYSNRFGSLRTAYERIGYETATRDANAPLVRAQMDFASEVGGLLEATGYQVALTASGRFLTLCEHIVLAPRLFDLRRDGERRLWRIKRPKSLGLNFVLAALMRNGVRENLYLLPIQRFGRSGKVEINDGPNHMEEFEVWELNLLPEMIRWFSRSPPPAETRHYLRGR